MSGNVPNVSRDSFVFGKMYDQVVMQQGKPVLDSDWNEQGDVLQMSQLLEARYLYGDISLPPSPAHSTIGYEIYQATSPANNFGIRGGWAFVKGVLVPTVVAATPSNVDYEYDSNRICEGQLDAVNSGAGTITDDDKNWASFYDLVGCRVKMTSGVEIGNTFTVSVHTSATTVQLSGGTGSIAADDTFIIKPPALTTPGGVRTDEVYLAVWWEDINDEEDPNIVNPGVAIETCHRRQRRWCVRVAENGTTPTTPDIHSFGVRYAKLADLNRTAAANILTAEIDNTMVAKNSIESEVYNDVIPDADDTYDLGSASMQWKDLYVDGTATIDVLNVSNAAGEGVANALYPTLDVNYNLGSATYRWNRLYVADVITEDLVADRIFPSDGAGEGVSGDLVPATDGSFDLGNGPYLWRDLLLSRDIYAVGLSLSASAGDGVSSTLVPKTDSVYNLGNASYQWEDLYLNGTADIGTLETFRVNSSLTPTTDDAYDLGLSSSQWRNLYLDGTANIDLLLVSGSAGEGVVGDLMPSVSAVRDIGSATYYWDDAYIDTLYYKTQSTFDSYDDLALVEEYSPIDVFKNSNKGGENRVVQQGDRNTIPWPMLGEKDPSKGDYFLHMGDSVMFLLGSIKQLYSKHQKAGERIEELEHRLREV